MHRWVVPAVKRDVQAVLLIFLGTALVRISLTDLYLRYVKAAMQPFLILTGVILLVLGVWALWDVIRDRGHEHPEDDLGAEVHDGHGHGQMRIAWLLMLPVLSILLIAPPALGAYSAERGNSSVAAPASDLGFDPLPAEDPIVMTLNEYATRAVWDNPGSLEGRTFELTGFVTPVPEAKMPTDLPADAEASWWLARLSLACCAADATATKILAVGAKPLPANTWVRATGRWIPGGGTETATAIPWLQIESLKPIPEPKDPYE